MSKDHRRTGHRARRASSDFGENEFAGHRHSRLQTLIRDELAALVRDEIVDPALADVAIREVELSLDYATARVRYALPSGRDPAAPDRALARAAGLLRARLVDALDLKRAPSLRFAVTYAIGEGSES